MISHQPLKTLLEPFGISLSTPQVSQVNAYLELLLRWNRKINLTAIRNQEECVTRHFGESFYLSRQLELRGSLLDIGSGAGFPGLALKILFPDVAATLLEPVTKKRAFLKEVTRACGMSSVTVRGERLENLALQAPGCMFDAATARAVGDLDRLVPNAAKCLKTGGHLCLWLGLDQVSAACQAVAGVEWNEPIALPLAHQRVILVGKRL